MALDDGTKVRVHYRGTLDDGTEFDSSYQRGEPIEFEIGAGNVIGGFDEAVKGMTVGDQLEVTIPSENAYGPHHEAALQRVEADRLPEGAGVGAMLQAMTEDGQPLAGTVVEMEEGMATIDFNHPLAGKDLTFELELVEVVDA
jgi:FKBP-type peptidyl-prolyl cis-trans isomerase 2